jgi:hypothetical protein
MPEISDELNGKSAFCQDFKQRQWKLAEFGISRRSLYRSKMVRIYMTLKAKSLFRHITRFSEKLYKELEFT